MTLQNKRRVLVTDRFKEGRSQDRVFYRDPTRQVGVTVAAGGAVLVYVLSHFQPR